MKILICDDDQSLLQVILSHVDWNSLGIEHVLTAENGAKAKELITRFKPEIILSDIGMPLVDGVEVLKFIREQGMDSEFAFLTCYEDFEYAREAVRYGARRYLTKPLIFDELNQALSEMAKEAKAKEEEQQQKNQQIVEDQLVLNSILRGLRDGMYEEDKDRINLRLQEHRSHLRAEEKIRLIPYRADLMTAEDTDRENPLWRKIAYLSTEWIQGSDSLEMAVIDVEEKTLRVLLYVTGELASDTKALKEKAERFVWETSTRLKVRPVVLISEELFLYETAGVYPRLVKDLHRLRFQEGRVFLSTEAEEPAQNESAVRSLVDEERIMGYLFSRDQAGYLRYMAGLVNQMTRQADTDIQMTLLHHALLQMFYRCAQNNFIDRHRIFDSAELRRCDGICERSSYDMIRFAEMLFVRMKDLLEESSIGGDSIERAKRYIQEHYSENIDRETIAAVACITPNYFSKLFHQETGLSLREYVNQLRIDEAKRLLLSTERPVSEVASEVGFDNISYFSTVFRKMMGLSPIEYRIQYQNKDLE